MSTPQTRRPERFRWGFATSAAVVLLAIVAGQAVGALLSGYPPAQALMRLLWGEEAGPVLSAMAARDWVFTAFLASAAVWVVVQRGGIRRFFLDMHTGVVLVSLSVLAVLLGVLVPQIEGFEDPRMRVTKENYEENYKAFRWAEGYFLYHLMRPYGIGMPQAEIPPSAREALADYGRAYGEEERKNREKMMESAFSGGSKSGEIGDFIARHDVALRRAFDVATALELNRLYKSSWFATLLGMLGVSVSLNALRGGLRRQFTIKKIGFFTTHTGMVVLLCGGLVSKLLTDRGILQLRLGEPPKDTYWRHYDPNKLARMPFAVRLDHFARKDWKALEVHFLDEDFSSRPPRYTLWEGREIPLDFARGEDGEWAPQVRLRVLELHERARIGEPRVYEGDPEEPEGQLPLVELEVPDFEHRHAEGEVHSDDEEPLRRKVLLSPMLRNQGYADPEGAFRMVVAYGESPETIFPPDELTLGWLDVQVLGGQSAMPRPVPVRVGERFDLLGGYQVEIVDATRDFRPVGDPEAKKRGSDDPRPLSEQPDGFKAVWIDIFPPAGGDPERRLVLEKIDAVAHGLQEGYENKALVAQLRWDAWSAPGGPRYVLRYGPGEDPTLVGEDGSVRVVAVGEPLPVAGGRAVPLRFLHHARVETHVEFLPGRERPDGWDPDFYSREPRGLVLEVTRFPGTPREEQEVVRLASTQSGRANVWISPDERFAAVFLENDEGFPQDWRSVLSVVEKDGDGRPYVVDLGPEKEREIRVNDYFKHRGYRFFQTNANAADPAYSGVGVVYDPGIPIVLIGMYTVIAGTVLAFIVRPIVLARRRKEEIA